MIRLKYEAGTHRLASPVTWFWFGANEALENESKIAKNHLELEKMEVILSMQYCDLLVL